MLLLNKFAAFVIWTRFVSMKQCLSFNTELSETSTNKKNPLKSAQREETSENYRGAILHSATGRHVMESTMVTRIHNLASAKTHHCFGKLAI